MATIRPVPKLSSVTSIRSASNRTGVSKTNPAVTAAPDPVRGQVVKATIVLTKDYEPSDSLAQELKDFVKHQTAPYKYPRIVEFVDELPKTISGKIRRVEIRNRTLQEQKNR